jgi:hypothetical protein
VGSIRKNRSKIDEPVDEKGGFPQCLIAERAEPVGDVIELTDKRLGGRLFSSISRCWFKEVTNCFNRLRRSLVAKDDLGI